MSSDPLLITGDFNIHVDVFGDADRARLLELLESMGLQQHVDKPTHVSGHTLDLVITRDVDELISTAPVVDYLFSDHITVICDLIIKKPSFTVKEISYRKIKGIDIELFSHDVRSSALIQDSPDNLDDLVNLYNTTLSEILDCHAPLVTKTIKVRPLVPWYDDDIKDARRERRRAERRWRRTRNSSDLTNFKAKKNYATYLMNVARKRFYTDFINENSSNQRDLFNATRKLLKQENEVLFPPLKDKLQLANEMGDFFVKKICDIHSKLDKMTEVLPSNDSDSLANPSKTAAVTMETFSQLTECNVRDLVLSSAKKTCMLDPIPTPLVVNCLDVLLPVLTKIINTSIMTGQFVDGWKCALVNPILKKAGLDLLYKNYRPISNLQYVSKLTERAVNNQTHGHMLQNHIYPVLQSSYRAGHSTETALLKVMNDIMLGMNSKCVTLLVLLDLSAAFDTVNHEILINRLQNKVGLQGTVLNWFKSYLSNRSQRISISGTLSKCFNLDCGVPQGSCLGPLLFIIYSSQLFDVIEKHLPSVHCFADDTQLYLCFKPDSQVSQDVAMRAMESCIADIRSWMISDRLLLNDEKTEMLLIGTQYQLNKLACDGCLHVGDMDIGSVACARNLGVWFDEKMSMSTHISKACSSAFFHLHNIRRIKKYLSVDSLRTIVHAFITSRLDYCNSLMYGLPNLQISKLQRVQNAAARLIMDIPKYSHITPALYELHWLPVAHRIKFKILILTFKSIYGLAPSYLSDLVKVKQTSSYSLRSNSSLLLEVPRETMRPTLGGRSFTSSAPALWNSLPADLRIITTLGVFKSKLKTFLFRSAF